MLSTSIRRKQIAAAGLDIVASEGLAALSIARIAGVIGVVPSALYRHHHSKDGIILAVLDLISERLLQNVKEAARGTAHSHAVLKRLMDRHVQMLQKTPGIPRLVFSDEIFQGQPVIRERLFQIISTYLSAVADVISEGQTQGSIRRDLPPKTGAVMFLGLVQPAAILELMSDGAFDTEAHVRSAWKFFEAMLRMTPAQAENPSTMELQTKVKGNRML